MSTIQTLLTTSNIATLDAEVLLSHTTGLARSSLLAYPERIISSQHCQQFKKLCERRLSGEPLAYLVQHKEFWSLTLKVTPDTLIPRPETELLVELALAILPTESQYIADLGTGSGAIALALATERPHWQITATDYYPDTLAIAKHNAKHLRLHIQFILSDWLSALPAKAFNAIISNPPYIAEQDSHLADLKYEPSYALCAGKDGLAALRTIIHQAPNYLCDDGWLLLEHGFDQGQAVRELMTVAGYSDITTHCDLANLERVTVGRLIRRPGRDAGIQTIGT